MDRKLEVGQSVSQLSTNTLKKENLFTVNKSFIGYNEINIQLSQIGFIRRN